MEEFAKAFQHNHDGSWTCIAPATLADVDRQRIQVAVGSTFVRGNYFMNVDVARWLDEQSGASSEMGVAPPREYRQSM